MSSQDIVLVFFIHACDWLFIDPSRYVGQHHNGCSLLSETSELVGLGGRFIKAPRTDISC